MTEDATQDPTNLEEAKAHAIEAAEEIREAAARKADQLKEAAVEQTERIRDAANDQLGDSREKLEELRREGERYVRAHPAKSVLIALGLGYLIGRILK